MVDFSYILTKKYCVPILKEKAYYSGHESKLSGRRGGGEKPKTGQPAINRKCCLHFFVFHHSIIQSVVNCPVIMLLSVVLFMIITCFAVIAFVAGVFSPLHDNNTQLVCFSSEQIEKSDN